MKHNIESTKKLGGEKKKKEGVAQHRNPRAVVEKIVRISLMEGSNSPTRPEPDLSFDGGGKSRA